MLSKDLETTLNEAFREARAKRHEFMTVEHLLLALLSNDAAVEVLRNVGCDIDKLREDLSEYIETTTPLIPAGDAKRETQPTLGFQRVLQRAVFHGQSSGRKEVTGGNVLVAIFSERESQSVYYLKQQDIARIDVVNYIAHGISKVYGEKGATESAVEGEERTQGEEGAQKALDAFATNLNEQAKAGRIDPLVGREQELERVIQVLCRRRKNNPLLVGRVRGRQNRHRGGFGQAHCRGEGAGRGGPEHHLRPRPWRAAGGHQVSGRLREALQGGARGVEGTGRGDTFH